MSPSFKAEKLKSILKNCKGIIFDFDGLIVDSEPFHYRAYSEVFKKYGHTIDPEEYWVEFTSKGKGIAGEIERYNLKLDVQPEDMRREKFEIYSRFCRDGEIKMFPDARKLVELLKARFAVAIASGSWGHDIRTILNHAGAAHLFPVILGKESAPKEKPHPDIFLNAASAMGCHPANCIVLEDALKGLDAAKRSGMACVIVRNRLNQSIDFHGADLIVSSLAELVSLVEMDTRLS